VVWRAAAVAAIVCVIGLRAQTPAIIVLPVQGTVSMMTVSGMNVTVQIGKNGVLLVDSPPVDAVPAVMAEIRKLTDKPIRYIVNTSDDGDHVGGNAAMVSAAVGREVRGAPMGALTGLGRDAGTAGHHRAHQRARAHVEGGACHASCGAADD
jgi:glyoxylase-like metal-dependent hydrolase (beta-lactamase superfamily II)